MDERPESGWTSAKGVIDDNVFVIKFAERTVLKRLEFDTARVDGKGRGAKDLLVVISHDGPSSGYKQIASLSLVDQQDKQSFPVKVEIPGRWVRLTVRNSTSG